MLALRILIAFYFAFGTLCITLTAVGMLLQLTDQLTGRRQPAVSAEERLVLAIAMTLPSSLSFLAAIGLLLRWRMVRLVLLGFAWYGVGGCIILAGAAFAIYIGLLERPANLRESAWEIIAMLVSSAVFSLWHLWALNRPAVCKAFTRPGKSENGTQRE